MSFEGVLGSMPVGRYEPPEEVTPTREVLRSAVQETLQTNPIPALYRWGSLATAQGSGQKITADAARGRIKDAGLEGQLTIGDQGSTDEAVSILIERKQDENRRKDLMSRAQGGLGETAATLGVSFLASLADPVGVAANFVPVVSHARYVGWLRAAGGGARGLAARTAIRAGVGGAEGLVGGALLEPFIYGSKTAEQADYDAGDSLTNIAFGGLFGAGLHTIGGAGLDAWRTATGQPIIKPDAPDGPPPKVADGKPAAGGAAPEAATPQQAVYDAEAKVRYANDLLRRARKTRDEQKISAAYDDLKAAERAEADARAGLGGAAPTAVPRGTSLGGATSVKIGDRYVAGRWAVVEGDQLAPSMEKAENQYRDRNRAASEVQVRNMAVNLDFNLLADNGPLMDVGAPTIARDGRVLGGNGRLAAIGRSYQAGVGYRYSEPLLESLERFGIDPETVNGMARPILVRVLDEDVDVKAAAIASNEGGAMRMSALEQAKVDAERLGDISGVEVGDTGDLNRPGNAQLIRQWVQGMPETQRAAVMDASGRLSAEGHTRLRNALLHRAYGDSPTLARLVDSADPGLRNVATALVRAAAKVAEVRGAIEGGALHALDVSPDLQAAVETLARLRDEGMSVEDYLNQGQLLAPELSPEALTVLEFLDRYIRSPGAMTAFLRRYHDIVASAGGPRQGGLFGEAVPDRLALLERAAAEVPQAADVVAAVRPETREAALRGAIAQAVSGRQIDVAAIIDADPSRDGVGADPAAAADAMGARAADPAAASLADPAAAAAVPEPEATPAPVLDDATAHMQEAEGEAADVAKAGEQSYLFSRDHPAPGFYSHALRVAESLPAGKTPASQWLAVLKNKGVKQEELDWMQLGPWLESLGRHATRDEVVDYMRANQLVLQETALGGGAKARVSLNPEWSVRNATSREDFEWLVTQAGHSIDEFDEAQHVPWPDHYFMLDPDGDVHLYLGAHPDEASARGAAVGTAIDAMGEDASENFAIIDLEQAKTRMIEEGWSATVNDLGWVEFRRRGHHLHSWLSFSEFMDQRDVSPVARRLAQSIMEMIPGSSDRGFGTPRHAAYKQPGGENYTEWLLRLPPLAERPTAPGSGGLPVLPPPNTTGWHVVSLDDGPVGGRALRVLNALDEVVGVRTFWRGTDEEAIANAAEHLHQRRLMDVAASTDNSPFMHPHWEDPDVVVHGRSTERTTVAGESVLHIEELQSDWHQQGFNYGYKPKDDAMPRGQRARDAPFKTTWPALILKRMLREAAERGVDRLSWTPGEVQNQRWGKDVRLRQLEAAWAPDTKSFHVGGPLIGEPSPRRYWTKNNLVIERDPTKPRADQETLSQMLGQDVANRILNDPLIVASMAEGRSERVAFDVDNLLVGEGRGMAQFYDQSIPSEIKALTKRYGTKVELVQLQSDASGYVIRWNDTDPDHAGQFLDREDGVGSMQFQTRTEAVDYVNRHAMSASWNVEPVSQSDFGALSIKITPALREAAMSGFAMFTKGGADKGTPADQLLTLVAQQFGTSTERLLDAGKIRVVSKASEIPGSIPEDTKAAYATDGTVYIVAERMHPHEVRGVLLHEIGVHAGMKKMLGPELYGRVLLDLSKLADKRDPLVLRAMAMVPRETPIPHVPEEVLAYLVQIAPRAGVVRRVLAAVKAWWYQVSGGHGTLGPDELVSLAVSALHKQARGAPSGQFAVHALSAARVSTTRAKERRLGDQRVDAALRAKINAMSPDEQVRAIYTNPVTGLPNLRAYQDSPAPGYHISIDLDGLKRINDTQGHDAGNALLKAFGDAAHGVTENIFHIGGDEFAIQARSASDAADVANRIIKSAKDTTFRYRDAAGKVVTHHGIEFGHGAGGTLKESDFRLTENKQRRREDVADAAAEAEAADVVASANAGIGAGGPGQVYRYSRDIGSPPDPKEEMAPFDEAIKRSELYAKAVRAAASAIGNDASARAAMKAATADKLAAEEIDTLLTQLKAEHGKVKAGLRKARTQFTADDTIDAMEDPAKQAAETVANNVKLDATIAKRDALLSMTARTKAVAKITAEFAANPSEGVLALLGGSSFARFGSKDSAFHWQRTYFTKWIKGFTYELDKAGLLDVFVRDAQGRDIARALHQIGQDVPRFDGLDPQAVEIAKIAHKYSEDARLTRNRFGAWIGKLDDYIGSQRHDMLKIRQAGRDVWKTFVRERLDVGRTFGEDAGNVERALDSLYDDFAAGRHMGPPSKDAKRVGQPGSLVRKVSASRVLHFRDADAQFDYMERFGAGSWREAILGDLSSASRQAGLLRVLGPNPGDTLQRVLDAVEESIAGDPANRRAFYENRAKAESVLSMLDGRSNIPGNEIAARVGTGLRAWQSMSKLGSAVVSSITDLPVYASAIRYQGRGGLLSGFAEAVGTILRGKATGERRAILGAIGSAADGIMGGVASRFDTDDLMSADTSELMRLFFKLNGLTWWTDTLREGMEISTSNWLAGISTQPHARIGADAQRVLAQYGIDAARWDALRSGRLQGADGKLYLTPESIKAVPDSVLAGYLERVGRTPSATGIAALRQDMADQVRNLIVDQAMTAVIEPDVRSRYFWTRGSKPGTALGEAARFVGQFKGFSTALTRQVFGREIYGRGYDSLGDYMRRGKGDMLGLAQLIVAMTVMGYVAMSAKAVLKGRTPQDPQSPKTWMAALLQGGALGIYGDFLLGQQNRMGRNALDTLAGPVPGVVGDLDDIRQRAMKGDDVAAGMVRILANNTPFMNMFYSRMALDYLILYRIQESLNPGSLRRMERSVEQQQGQTFLLRPSEAVH